MSSTFRVVTALMITRCSAGARSLLGVGYSTVAATAAQHRAADLRAAGQYIVASIPPVPLRSGCADVIYTGKGALIWIVDLAAWAAEVVRLLHPGGHLFVLESHPPGAVMVVGRGRGSAAPGP